MAGQLRLLIRPGPLLESVCLPWIGHRSTAHGSLGWGIFFCGAGDQIKGYFTTKHLLNFYFEVDLL